MEKDRRGFTLLELLIVVAIIAVLVAIAIPVMVGSKKRAVLAANQANARSGYAAAALEFQGDTDTHAGGLTLSQRKGHYFYIYSVRAARCVDDARFKPNYFESGGTLRFQYIHLFDPDPDSSHSFSGFMPSFFLVQSGGKGDADFSSWTVDTAFDNPAKKKLSECTVVMWVYELDSDGRLVGVYGSYSELFKHMGY